MNKFDNIYRTNQDLVFRFLMKLCGDSALAEELCQETFYRAYMNLSALKSEDRASAWLCSIAKNTYFAYYNEQKKKTEIPDTLEDVSADITEVFEQKELADRAFLCLHALEEPYKEVFMLYVFAGFSLKNISSVFQKSESWARVTYYRAKQKIMEGLAENDL